MKSLARGARATGSSVPRIVKRAGQRAYPTNSVSWDATASRSGALEGVWPTSDRRRGFVAAKRASRIKLRCRSMADTRGEAGSGRGRTSRLRWCRKSWRAVKWSGGGVRRAAAAAGGRRTGKMGETTGSAPPALSPTRHRPAPPPRRPGAGSPAGRAAGKIAHTSGAGAGSEGFQLLSSRGAGDAADGQANARRWQWSVTAGWSFRVCP